MTPLVLLPGFMCDTRLFQPQIAELRSEYDIHCPALLGADTIEGLATHLLDGLPPRFALAGLSMGGIVAMQMVAIAPERISRLCLMDTNASPENPKIAALRDAQVTRVLNGELPVVMRDEMKPNYLADGPDRDRILDMCMDMANTLGRDTFVAQSNALKTRPDQRPSLSRVQQPTLVLCGEQDTLCPLHRHEVIAQAVPNSTLTVVKGAGHLPSLEQPAQTTQALCDWLRAD